MFSETESYQKWKRIILLALKIGIGSSISIGIAELFQLDYAISAGTVTLLTLMTTKNETFRLVLARFVTLTLTLAVGYFVFTHFSTEWATYSIVLAVIVFVAEACGWRTTISVNAVVAAHIVQNQEYTLASIMNEFYLVLIGVCVAMVFNLFHANYSHKRAIIASMRDVEQKLQAILRGIADNLNGKRISAGVWQKIKDLEKELEEHVDSSIIYQDNTFNTHPEYYISYFKMRSEQCQILGRFHDEVTKMSSRPEQASIVASYLYYLSDYILELNVPEKQVEKLNELLNSMKFQELPKSRIEFESRALLYHMLMDLQDFLRCKTEFVDGLDDVQRRLYWNAGEKKEKLVQAAASK